LAVVDAVIKLAHALGLRVVAEGVETARQRDILLSLNCDELQGYFFAKPMSAAKLTLWAMVDDKNEQQDFRPSLYVSGHQMLQ
jgi:EAL domain-containing protein (putative c-di-GMP-specific phosphodiesterase class I)